MTRPVVWSRDAVDELKSIARYIAKDDPRSAKRVAAAIREIGAKLGLRSTGRRGRVDGTFEKPLAPLPYIIAYAVKRDDGGEAIVILRVIHTARDWQPGSWPSCAREPVVRIGVAQVGEAAPGVAKPPSTTYIRGNARARFAVGLAGAAAGRI